MPPKQKETTPPGKSSSGKGILGEYGDLITFWTVCVAAITATFVGLFLFKLFWLFRMVLLAHWSFLFGSSMYPKDSSMSLKFSLGLFTVILLSTVISRFVPKIRMVTTALSIPPQLHMLYVLNRVYRSFSKQPESQTLTKSVQFYSALTLTSVVATACTLVVDLRNKLF